MKVLWLSRHEMTRVQERRLRDILPEEERESAEIICRMQVWQLTDDEEADNEVNAKAWLKLNEEAEVIAGVFPPVAIVGLLTARGLADDGDDDFARLWGEPMVVTPVSQVGQTLKNGMTQKQFKFLRWQHI